MPSSNEVTTARLFTIQDYVQQLSLFHNFHFSFNSAFQKNLPSPPASEAQGIESPPSEGSGCRFESDPGQETKKPRKPGAFSNAQVEHPTSEVREFYLRHLEPTVHNYEKLLSVHPQSMSQPWSKFPS